MISGVGIVLLMRVFQIYIILVGQGMLRSWEVMHYSNGRIFWDLQFRCSVNDQKSQSLDGFMLLIYSTKVQGASSNKLCWKLTSGRGFDVSGYYHSLSPSIVVSFQWKMV